jgi:hypothetical protein
MTNTVVILNNDRIDIYAEISKCKLVNILCSAPIRTQLFNSIKSVAQYTENVNPRLDRKKLRFRSYVGDNDTNI